MQPTTPPSIAGTSSSLKNRKILLEKIYKHSETNIMLSKRSKNQKRDFYSELMYLIYYKKKKKLNYK